MSAIFVQFSDESETAISSVFGCKQNPDFYPNQGEVDANDDRYAAYVKSIPDCQKQALPSPSATPDA
ncbi:hypothetical protein [Burkholderia lata]|uniref:hypothetical protein n=1 Tax=Burkholderia lata (strain ATCC 17760 / DSM 23089 / LMG 22485 / NCIMB 9086 / R18194 / 383) TaxID=482957 RepID=UPI001452E3D8|nr:hypothetical protein [Burkholderia lata]VWB98605.1 hypothetical protein BLA15816_04767 [Burkholderia lata]